MFESHAFLLAAGMFLGAALYTSVGHAGASAYIALMALFGLSPAVMRPTALALNILVAGFTSFRYLRAGLFRWRTVWPFLIGAVPFAFVGGQSRYRLPTTDHLLASFCCLAAQARPSRPPRCSIKAFLLCH